MHLVSVDHVWQVSLDGDAVGPVSAGDDFGGWAWAPQQDWLLGARICAMAATKVIANAILNTGFINVWLATTC